LEKSTTGSIRLIEFELRGDYITLDALLKVTGVADSGGAGKAMVADGKVQVDGQQELRKTFKVRAGQVVSVGGMRIRVHAPTMPTPWAGQPTEFFPREAVVARRSGCGRVRSGSSGRR
jgi:ribosome-associated protein